VVLDSSSCVMMVQYVPEARLILPRSPARISMLETTVPSGMDFRGRTLPMVKLALAPQYKNWPVKMPSAAMKHIFCCLYLYGSLKTTCARGAPVVKTAKITEVHQTRTRKWGKTTVCRQHARQTTAALVHDFLHNALDVAIALGEVQSSVLGWSLAQALVGPEDSPRSLTLRSDDTAPGKRKHNHNA